MDDLVIIFWFINILIFLYFLGETSLAYCFEAWGEHGEKRIFYSIFSLVVQFILPLTLIGLANNAIKRKLQNLPRLVSMNYGFPIFADIYIGHDFCHNYLNFIP